MARAVLLAGGDKTGTWLTPSAQVPAGLETVTVYLMPSAGERLVPKTGKMHLYMLLTADEAIANAKTIADHLARGTITFREDASGTWQHVLGSDDFQIDATGEPLLEIGAQRLAGRTVRVEAAFDRRVDYGIEIELT